MASTIGIKVDGLEALYNKLITHYPGIAQKAMAKALYTEAEKIMSASKSLVPVDTGTLRSSGHVQSPVVNGFKIRIELGYGGPSVKYAWKVHEDLNAHHTTGQAKYLEQPLMEAEAGILDRIKSTVAAEVFKTTGGSL